MKNLKKLRPLPYLSVIEIIAGVDFVNAMTQIDFRVHMTLD